MFSTIAGSGSGFTSDADFARAFNSAPAGSSGRSGFLPPFQVHCLCSLFASFVSIFSCHIFCFTLSLSLAQNLYSIPVGGHPAFMVFEIEGPVTCFHYAAVLICSCKCFTVFWVKALDTGWQLPPHVPSWADLIPWFPYIFCLFPAFYHICCFNFLAFVIFKSVW